MSGKRPSNDVLIRYLDGRFKSVNLILQDMRDKDESHDKNMKEMAATIGKINVTLAKQEQQIAYHIKRTDILEKDLKPIKSWFDTVLRIFGAISFIIMMIGGVVKLAEIWFYIHAGG